MARMRMMPRAVPLGVHVPGDTVIHRAGAGLKLIVVTLFILLATIFGRSPVGVAVCAVLVAAGYLVARIPWAAAWAQIAAPLPLLLVLGAFQWWQNDLVTGAVTVGLLACSIMGAGLLPLTTTIEELLDAVERGLRPLKRYGVPAENIALALSLTLRLIPLQLATVGDVLDARRARGAGFSLTAVATPVIVRSLRRARALAEALAARGAGD